MSLAGTPALIALMATVVVVAGTVNGIAGFGFAVIGTMTLATILDPATAVVFMILPILGVNISLVSDLSGQELRSCGRRFAPLLLSALVGTIVGMFLLERIPEAPLRVLLGVVALAFVASVQRRVPLPGFTGAKDRCFVETQAAMTGVGGLSGLLFGGTNVGVQLVAYIRSCNLSHGLFIGVVAMIFLGLNGARVVFAGVLGLYSGTTLALISLLAVIPAVLGVAAGKRLRHRITPAQRRIIVLGLLTVIGVRLVLGGLGLV